MRHREQRVVTSLTLASKQPTRGRTAASTGAASARLPLTS
jgi:hypothetical protein